MTTPEKPLEVIFEPGCFDDFDGSPEELAKLIATIKQMFASGEPPEARPLTEEEIDELEQQMAKRPTRQ